MGLFSKKYNTNSILIMIALIAFISFCIYIIVKQSKKLKDNFNNNNNLPIVPVIPANWDTLSAATKQVGVNRSDTDPDFKEEMESACNFIPRGPNKNTCEQICTGENNGFWEINDGCDYNSCKEICQGCHDPEQCDWLNNNIADFSLIPKKLDVMIIEGENSVELKWRCIDVLNNKTKQFVVNYFDPIETEQGVKAKIINRKAGQDNYSIKIDNLDNGTKYGFVVYAVNEVGNGPDSEIVYGTPNKSNITYY